MRIAAAMVALGLLAGCSDRGPSDLGRAAGIAAGSVSAPAPGSPPVTAGAALAATDAALIAVAAGEGPPAHLVALADNGGHVTYGDAARRAVVLHGGIVSGTRGLGHDLIGLRLGRDDPVAYPRPLADWPGQIAREYRYRVRGGQEYGITLVCLYARGDRQRIAPAGVPVTVVEIAETCSNHRRRVQNRYWIEPETGAAIASRQWAGPGVPVLAVTVLRPYAPARRW